MTSQLVLFCVGTLCWLFYAFFFVLYVGAFFYSEVFVGCFLFQLYFDRLRCCLLFFVFPCTNVHLVHLSKPNSIQISSKYCFTSFSWSANFLSFGSKSFTSSVYSRCHLSCFIDHFFCCMSDCIRVLVPWWGYSVGPERDKTWEGKGCHLVRYHVVCLLLGFQSFLSSKVVSELYSRASFLSESVWLFGGQFCILVYILLFMNVGHYQRLFCNLSRLWISWFVGTCNFRVCFCSTINVLLFHSIPFYILSALRLSSVNPNVPF